MITDSNLQEAMKIALGEDHRWLNEECDWWDYLVDTNPLRLRDEARTMASVLRRLIPEYQELQWRMEGLQK